MKYIVGIVLSFCLFAFSFGGFVPCDLDLPDPTGSILNQLPTECHDLDESTKGLLLRESESFKQFHEKLLKYEAAQGKNTEEEIYMDMDFRRELYTVGDLQACLDIEESLEQYVQCLIEKRVNMVALIESKPSRL